MSDFRLMSLSHTVKSIAYVFVFALCLTLLLAPNPIIAPGIGLDETWKIALQVAFESGMIFGQEFIFTYGPLGFLSARLWSPHTRGLILIYDLWIVFQIILMLWHTLSTSVGRMIGALIVCLIVGNAHYYLDPPIILFLLSTFFLYLSREKRSSWLFFCAALNATLALFIKVNLGLAALLQLGAVLIFDTVRTERSRYSLVNSCLTVALFGIALYAIPTDLYNYIRGSLHIANGFNDAMYLPLRDPHLFSSALWALAITGVALLISALGDRNYLLCFSVAGFSYLLLKQAFVRADEHDLVFFDYCIVAPALLAFFSKKDGWLPCAPFVVIAALSLYLTPPAPSIFSDKLSDIETYLSSHGGPSADDAINKNLLTEEVRNRVGDQHIDAMPDNGSRLFHAGLQYRPRPVIQSYTAYDEYLDGINARFVEARGFPFFAISHGCIDYRYCLHDETQTKLALLRWYEPVLHEDEQLLLKRRADPKPLSEHLIFSGRARFGQRISVPPSNHPLIFRFEVSYSLRGALRRVLFQPPPLRMTIKSGDIKQTYRAVPPILKGGVIGNLLIENNENLYALYSGEISRIPRIEFIRIHSNLSSGYRQEILYSIAEFRQ